MGDFAPIVAAIISTSGAILVAYLAARRFRKSGPPDTVAQLARTQRELLELEKAKSELWQERYNSEVAAHVKTRQQRDQAQYDADTCQRRLDNAYADMRLDTATHITRDEKLIRPGETLGEGETGTK